MKVFNLYNDELDNSNEREGWNFRAAKVGEHIGGESIGAGLYEAEPGNKVWLYHTHHAMRSGAWSFAASPRSARPSQRPVLGPRPVLPAGQGGSAHHVWNGSESHRTLVPSVERLAHRRTRVEFACASGRDCRPKAGRLTGTGRRPGGVGVRTSPTPIQFLPLNGVRSCRCPRRPLRSPPCRAVLRRSDRS